MMFLSIPNYEDLKHGAKVRINGHDTVVTEDDGYLVYANGTGEYQRCEILARTPAGVLALPQGGEAECTQYTCNSHGQTDGIIVAPVITRLNGGTLLTFTREGSKA